MSAFYKTGIQLAAKSAPTHDTFSILEDVGIKAVEVYTDEIQLSRSEIIDICHDFNFDYVVHAPNDIYAPEKIFNLAKSIKAKLVVTHDIYWEDEWPEIMQHSTESGIPLVIENVDGAFTFQKVLRRYNLKRCLDFEHIIYQMGGFAPDVLSNVITDTVHVHLTGYEHGNGKHHTHFYESAKQSMEILRLLNDCGYNGMVVSEALPEYQTRERFQKLVEFYMGFEEIKE